MLKFNIKNRSKMLKITPFALLLFMYGCSTPQNQQVPVVDVQGYDQSPPNISSTNNASIEKYQGNETNVVNVSQNNQNSTAVTTYHEKSLQELSHKDINIPRKADGKPDYSKITKGSYNEEAYYTKQGDTLYLVSYLSGQPVEKIAQLNNLNQPYTLSPNQIIRLKEAKVATVSAAPVVKIVPQTNAVTEKPEVKVVNVTNNTANVNNNEWVWPTSGKIIQGFGKGDGGNKGIDIAGSKGQPILAASKGRVAYAGRDLNGYGNLIILRHGDSFLSTYAHNDTILVKKDQIVEKGQKIATMGDTDANRSKLHFEIRRRGESVDPLLYLPKK